MNIKLAIALFTCTIITNSSVFAMAPDNPEEHTPVLPKKPITDYSSEDEFLKSLHDGIVAGYWTDPNIDRGSDSETPAKE